MIKKEYMKPSVKAVELQHKSRILAGSVTSITTTGLDDDLVLPTDKEEKSGNVWDDAL